jgi:hypothetical protein
MLPRAFGNGFERLSPARVARAVSEQQQTSIHDSPSADEYVVRSPGGMRAGLGAALRSSRFIGSAPTS